MKKKIGIALIVLSVAIMTIAGVGYGPSSLQARWKDPLTPVFSDIGSPYKTTVAIATTDTSTSFASAMATALSATINWDVVKGALITCETNDARIAFATNAVKGASPVGHIIYVGQSYWIPSSEWCKLAFIISKTAGSAASLQVTLVMN